MSRLRTELAAGTLGGAQQRADGWHQTFHLPASFAGFEGHFPGNPVVPAVVQLLMGALLAEAALGRRLAIAEVARAKFLHPLRPEEDIAVHGAPEGDAALCWRIRITCAAGTAAQFRLRFAEPDGAKTEATP